MFRPAVPGQVCSLGYRLIADLRRDLGLELTKEQKLRLVEFYRLDPETGRRLVRRAALRRPKGAGKSPEGGYCGFAELCLPVLFSHFDGKGQPVGKPHPDPWVQFAAVSEDQTDNVNVWLFDILSARPETLRRHHLDLGRSRIYFTDRSGRLEPVTASAGSREGQRVTFAVLDQTESWTKENGGIRLADTLRRNTGKMGGWSLELQNAPGLGDGSVADRTSKASDRRAAGVLFDTREPAGFVDLDDHSDAGRGKLRAALEFVYGESIAWVPVDRVIEEIWDPDTDPNDARRYYLNIAAPSSDWAFDRARWDALGDGQVAEPGALIVAGFDGARHDDATALVAVEVDTGHAWLAGLWERPDGVEDWEVPEAEVTAAVEELFARWSVWRIYCDPPYWEPTIASWEAKFKGTDRKPAVFTWWTNRWRQVGYATRSLAGAIRSGDIHHVTDEPDDLSRHVRNAVRRPVNSRDDQGRPLWTIAKPAPSRKIDAAMALTLAWEARNDALAAGASVRRRGEAAGF